MNVLTDSTVLFLIVFRLKGCHFYNAYGLRKEEDSTNDNVLIIKIYELIDWNELNGDANS